MLTGAEIWQLVFIGIAIFAVVGLLLVGRRLRTTGAMNRARLGGVLAAIFLILIVAVVGALFTRPT